jgi:hypothetical protein
MEEPGVQCTVVFTFTVTEPASECVCVQGEGVTAPPPPHPTSRGSVTIYAKTTVQCSLGSSMFGDLGTVTVPDVRQD